MLVKPQNAVTDTIARIYHSDNVLMVSFPERNDEFREIIKHSLSFRWDEYKFCWSRKTFYGSINDRVSETGNALLSNGFIVDFPDQETAQNALNYNYTPEPQAHIKKHNNDYFVVVWRYGHSLYNKAIKIKGARYCKPYVCIPKERHNDIIDFAEIHNCVINESAIDLCNCAISELENALVFEQRTTKSKSEDYSIPKDLLD